MSAIVMNANKIFLYLATQATYTRPTVSPNIGARISASSGGTTYVKTTSGSIITVVPKSLATLGGKIISSNIVSGKSTTAYNKSAWKYVSQNWRE